jgi:NAD(P)-dependent dehydrogenase (short-subunit alcohol dehydrogenase family)
MDNEAVRQVATTVQSEVGKVDILINNSNRGHIVTVGTTALFPLPSS